MTQDEIIMMARQVGYTPFEALKWEQALTNFAKLVAAKEREMDLALAECEQENRLLRARVDRMEREFALERQQLLNENTEIYGLLGMAHLNLKQHLEYGFNPKTATSTLISVGRYAPKLREAMKLEARHENKT